jgi:hypothetical protein
MDMSMEDSSTCGRTRRLCACLAALLVFGAWMSGCQKSQSWREPGPKATFEQFLMHWFKNERAKAFDMIVEEDRKALTAPRGVLREKLGEEQLAERQEMLVAGRVDNPYDIRSMDLKPPLEEAPAPGQTVTLDLEYQDGREGTARLTWTGDRWAIDLPLEDSTPSDVP